MGVKQQLAAYYDLQGLTGKHRRKAVQYDRRSLRKQADGHTGTVGGGPDYIRDEHGNYRDINHAMHWEPSAEGHLYWAMRDGEQLVPDWWDRTHFVLSAGPVRTIR